MGRGGGGGHSKPSTKPSSSVRRQSSITHGRTLEEELDRRREIGDSILLSQFDKFADLKDEETTAEGGFNSGPRAASTSGSFSKRTPQHRMTKHGLFKALTEMHLKRDDDEIERLMKQMGSNSDGVINVYEFLMLVKTLQRKTLQKKTKEELGSAFEKIRGVLGGHCTGNSVYAYKERNHQLEAVMVGLATMIEGLREYSTEMEELEKRYEELETERKQLVTPVDPSIPEKKREQEGEELSWHSKQILDRNMKYKEPP